MLRPEKVCELPAVVLDKRKRIVVADHDRVAHGLQQSLIVCIGCSRGHEMVRTHQIARVAPGKKPLKNLQVHGVKPKRRRRRPGGRHAR